MKKAWMVIYLAALPAAIGLLALSFGIVFDTDFFPILVSAFSIIATLLFGSLFNIFSVASALDRTKVSREFLFEDFKADLQRINAGVAYLVGLSTFLLVATLALFVIDLAEEMETFIVVYLLTHFLLIMVPLIVRVYRFLDFAYRKL